MPVDETASNVGDTLLLTKGVPSDVEIYLVNEFDELEDLSAASNAIVQIKDRPGDVSVVTTLLDRNADITIGTGLLSLTLTQAESDALVRGFWWLFASVEIGGDRYHLEKPVRVEVTET